MAKLYKWQEKVFEKVENMTNSELLNETLGLAGGDDYDGCFTNRGWFEYQVLEATLKDALSEWLAVDAAVDAAIADAEGEERRGNSD